VTRLDSSAQSLDPRVVRTRHDVLHAAIDIAVTDGLDGVTQPNVARKAGYSKVTVYAHWPERIDLIRDAFSMLGEMPHYEAVGDLRSDLIGELHGFRDAMQSYRLDRILAVLAEGSTAWPELVPVRDRFVADGERPIRVMLARHLRGARLDAAVLMLCGTVVHSTLMRGEAPSDAVIARAVDAVLSMTQPS
jgi:AcrR family transcriptional regulator